MSAKDVPHAAASKQAIAELKKMSKAELLATFVEAGIATKTGRLTKQYQPLKPTKRAG